MDFSPLRKLPERWREEARTLRLYGHEPTAKACERHAEEMEEAVRAYQEETLTVAEAAEESGYSESHLRALLAETKLANAGREGAPRIRRGDLPAKPKPATRPILSLAEEALDRRRA